MPKNIACVWLRKNCLEHKKEKEGKKKEENKKKAGVFVLQALTSTYNYFRGKNKEQK